MAEKQASGSGRQKRRRTHNPRHTGPPDLCKDTFLSEALKKNPLFSSPRVFQTNQQPSFLSPVLCIKNQHFCIFLIILLKSYLPLTIARKGFQISNTLLDLGPSVYQGKSTCLKVFSFSDCVTLSSWPVAFFTVVLSYPAAIYPFLNLLGSQLLCREYFFSYF